MLRLFFGLFVLFFTVLSAGAQTTFSGKVVLDKTIASFKTENPVPGTLYLLTGGASAVRVVSEEPFSAEVDFMEAKWLSDTELTSSTVLLVFEGESFAKDVLMRKPKTGGEDKVYPYRKFQVAAVFLKNVSTPKGTIPAFRVLYIPILF